MRSNEERHYVDNDILATCITPPRTASPKLRRNKRLENRWGQKYYTAVKEAVFILRANPFAPVEPPLQLREEADDCQPLYVCEQCQDCFRFLSSLEDHNSRRSWILGYWCYNCFFTECSHAQKSQLPCVDCQALNRQRKTFLRAKGLRKGRKLGCINIFYNQCQFFAHLKRHRTQIVDMADVMLMPVPTDVDKECYSELERLCKIIMERMFLTRNHIMDWLKAHQLGNKWWRLFQSDSKESEHRLAEMLKATVNQGGKKSVKRLVKPQKTTVTVPGSPAVPLLRSASVTCSSKSNPSSTISETIESVIAQSTWKQTESSVKSETSKTSPLSSVTFIDPLEPIEDDDNPCTTADIAFVDCGPAARMYPPDVAILLPSKDKLTIKTNEDTSFCKIVDPLPPNRESHSVSRVSEDQLMIKQQPEHNAVHTKSSTASTPAGQPVFEPKISVKKFAYETLQSPPAISCQKNYSRLASQKPHILRKLAPAPKVRLGGAKTSLPSVMEITRAVETSNKMVAQASISSMGSKILTVHRPKNADLSKIISQLPPDVINGKKLVFIGQDSDGFTILPKNDAISSSLGMIKIQSENDKAKIIKNLPAKAPPSGASNIGSEQGARAASDPLKQNSLPDQTKPKMQQIYLDGKVIYQNGKKFIIRPARKPVPNVPESTVCNNINNLKLPTIPKRLSLSSFLSKARNPVTSPIPIAIKPNDTAANKLLFPLTLSAVTSSTSPSSSPPSSLSPTPSTSKDRKASRFKVQLKQNGNNSKSVAKLTDSSNSTKPQSPASASVRTPSLHNIQNRDGVEYFSIETDAMGRSYVDFSIKKSLSWTQAAVNYKQQMLENFRRLGEERIKQHIDHLKEVNAEYSRMAGVSDDTIISENLKAIEDFENSLKEQPSCSEKDQDIVQGSSADDVNEILSSLREIRDPPTKCPTCSRITKSEPRILEFSRGADTRLGCCNCNNHVCHICDVFQGNMSRFGAHLNFHAKREPFTCPECFRKFPSFHRLETHTWTTCFHPLARRWFKCRVCQIEGFRDMESVTKHFILAHSKLKIACPECGILLKSRGDFEKHREDHPKATSLLKPVNFMACDIGNCVVRLENYRPHMDHHTAVINMLYYKCCFCSFLIKATKRGKEQIKFHLYHKHSEQLAELVSAECLPDVMPVKHLEKTKYQLFTEHLDRLKRPSASEDNSQSNSNQDNRNDSRSNLCSEEKHRRKDVIESEQDSDISESVLNNTEMNSTANSSHPDNQSCNYPDLKLKKQTPKDSGEHGGRSKNFCRSELSKSLEIMTTEHDAGNTQNNVITEYSSSPKIFDVRSVTPDSYAELGGGPKESTDLVVRGDESTSQSVSGNFRGTKVLEKPDQIVVSENQPKDPLLIKMGEKILPMKLRQVIVVNQAEGDMNITQMLQSTITASDSFVKLSELTNSEEKPVGDNTVVLWTEPTDKEKDVLQTKEPSVPVINTVFTLARTSDPKQYKRIPTDSTSIKILPESVEVWPEHFMGGRKQNLPVSILKSQNSGTGKAVIDITGSNNHVSDPHLQGPNVTQLDTKNLDTNEEEKNDLLLRNMPKPPPLARIPQHLLEISQQNDEDEEEEPQEIQVTVPKSVYKSRRGPRQLWRIAFNASTNSSELINYHCHLCGDFINTSWSVLRSHFSSKHSEDYKLSTVTPRLLRMSSDFISEGYREVLGLKKRKSDGSVSSSKRRKRWNPKKHIEKHSLGPGLCIQQESVQDREGNFVCKKCDQRCNDISSLRTHIGTNHRIKDHYLVCLECGANFVVEPSLQMHLKAFHRIQDPCTYLAQNTGYAKEITETIEDEPKTGIANQCHVCMAVFEDKLAVDKHLRVHGMAFLNRKRIEAQNAARNPEKKIKIVKTDDSSVAAVAVGAAANDDKLESRNLCKTGTLNSEQQKVEIRETSS